MKRLKHIYKYLISPTYRFWVDLCTEQENIDRSMKEIQTILQLRAHPMFIVKNSTCEMSTEPFIGKVVIEEINQNNVL